MSELRRTPMPRSTRPLRRGALKRAPLKRSRAKRTAPRDTGPDRKTRELVLQRDGHACVCCGRSIIGQPYSLQHRKARGVGGDNSPCNLVTMLGTGTTGCHGRVEGRANPHDHARGYRLESWENPALVSVMVFSEGGSGGRFWPASDGQWVSSPPAGGDA